MIDSFGRKIDYLRISVTDRCSLRCTYCMPEEGVEWLPHTEILRYEQLLRICRIFVSLGITKFKLTGGEPLVREDVVECAQGISGRGFPWGMVTNGLYLTPELLRRLKDAGLCSVTISLDGLEAEHNWLRRHPDSFRMASRAIDMIVQDGTLAYDVMTCVHQHNYDTLPQLRDYLIAKGVGDWRLATIFPVGRGAGDKALQLSGEQLRGLLRFIRQTRQEGQIHASYGCEGFLGSFEGDVRDWMFHCVAGVTVASVLVDGGISACTSIRHNYRQGNIYEDDFMDVWEHRFAPHRDHQWMKTGDCLGCRYWRYCEGGGLHLRDDDGKLLLCHVRRMGKLLPPSNNQLVDKQ